ncbi:integrase, catalytic region, zinc finger, CCHC-type containing protein, partial [Tanacetum coccineum]
VVQIVLWIVDSGCSKHMTGYGDYTHGNITICHVYYVEGLGHNLFSVGQFCDGDLEVAFRSKTCYVRNLEGDDLLTGGRDSNLYTISISDMAASSPICLMSKATSTKSWLWHRRLSHLNFGTINDLTKLDLVDGLPKFKYEKDHLCSACERGKSKKASHPPNLTSYGFVRSNKSIMQQFSIARTPQQNGVVERRNYTLVEATRTMLIFSSVIRTNDRDDLGKMKPKADIGVFIGYSETSRGFRIYNRSTKRIMETIHVKFDELTTISSEHDCLEPELQQFNNQNSLDDLMNHSFKRVPATDIRTNDHPLDQVLVPIQTCYDSSTGHTDSSELSSWHNNNIEGEGDRVWHCQMRVVRALREQCRYRDLGVVCKQEASASVPWIYMAQFWHTLKEDRSKHQLNLGRRYARYSPVLVYTALHDVSKGLSQSSRDDISKNIFNSGRNKKIQGCLSSDRQSRSRLESNPRTPRTPSASRSPNPATKTAESSGPKRSTVIRFQLSSRQSARLTPPVPVPSAEKADEMIL